VSYEIKSKSQHQDVTAGGTASGDLSGSATAGYDAIVDQECKLPWRNATAGRRNSPCAVDTRRRAALARRSARYPFARARPRFTLLTAGRGLFLYADCASGASRLSKHAAGFKQQCNRDKKPMGLDGGCP
jgi:hypothetical protein